MKEVFEKIKNGIQVKKDYFQRFYECEGKTKHDADLNKATQLAFDDAIKVVDRVAEEFLVSAKNAHTGWIACLDRLPDYLDNVLVCTENGGMTIAHLKHTPNEWRDMYMNKIDDVIAWKYLEAPYQPKGE